MLALFFTAFLLGVALTLIIEAVIDHGRED